MSYFFLRHVILKFAISSLSPPQRWYLGTRRIKYGSPRTESLSAQVNFYTVNLAKDYIYMYLITCRVSGFSRNNLIPANYNDILEQENPTLQ